MSRGKEWVKLGPRAAMAQAYPTRLLRLIVPFAAGGTSDILARPLAQRLSERLGQQVIVDNKPGGGTNVGVQAVVNSPPDGYTLLLGSSGNTINSSLYKNLPFNFLTDIVPVAALVRVPLVLVVHPSVPASNVAEFIAFAKANPGKVNFASSGVRYVAPSLRRVVQGHGGDRNVPRPLSRRSPRPHRRD